MNLYCVMYAVAVSSILTSGDILSDRRTMLNDLTWRNEEALMSIDLKVRMKKASYTSSNYLRKYCDCDETLNDPVCASNGYLYKNECLFKCALIKSPWLNLAESDDLCGSQTFNKMKEAEYKSHY